jgi:hypothetical protein
MGMGAGSVSCGLGWPLKTLVTPSIFTPDAFWESFHASWDLLGSRYPQIRTMDPNWRVGSWFAFGVQLVALWVPLAAKIDAAGNRTDIAQPTKTTRFERALKGWRVVTAWRSS